MTDGAERTIDARGGAGVLGASLAAAASSYVVLLVAARSLSPAANADFLAFWGLLFSAFGILIGVQTELTRATSASAKERNGVRAIVPGSLAGVVLATAVLLTGAAWLPHVLGPDWGRVVPWICLATTCFSVHVSVLGILAGDKRWKPYSALIAAESVTRLVVIVGAIALVGATVFRLSTSVALAAATTVVVLWLPVLRTTLSARADAGWRQLSIGIAHACTAAAASALLVVGYPVIVRITSSDAVYDTSAGLLLAVALTRGPLLIPLGAFQSVVVAHIATDPVRGVRSLVRILLRVLLITTAATVPAALLGPPLLELVNDRYIVSAATFAGLTVGAGLLAVLTLTGSACVACSLHVWASAGWLVATALAAGVLLLHGRLDLLVVASLVLGPVAGSLLHGIALVRSRRTT